MRGNFPAGGEGAEKVRTQNFRKNIVPFQKSAAKKILPQLGWDGPPCISWPQTSGRFFYFRQISNINELFLWDTRPEPEQREWFRAADFWKEFYPAHGRGSRGFTTAFFILINKLKRTRTLISQSGTTNFSCEWMEQRRDRLFSFPLFLYFYPHG